MNRAASTPLDRKPRNSQTERRSIKGASLQASSSRPDLVAGSSAGTVAKRGSAQKPGNRMTEFDPQLVSSFKRNFVFLQRVFSLDTFLRPLPPQIAQGIARSVHSFTRIFTQFWDPQGIKNAQTAMGIRKSDVSHVRRLRDRED